MRTIQDRRAQRQFGDAIRRDEVRGRVSLRRAQFRLVEAGNVPMIIWLAKVRLGQKDNAACMRLSLPSIETAHDVSKAAEEGLQSMYVKEGYPCRITVG